MMNKKINIRSFLNALGTFLYVCLVVTLLSNAQHIFGQKETFLIPIFMLLLLIISASITGSLVLGKPILLYVAGEKREAFTLFFATLGWLVLFLTIVGAIMIGIA